MRHFALAVAILMILASPAFAQFLGSEWGMTRAEIEQREGRPLAIEHDANDLGETLEILIYERPMFETTVSVEFIVRPDHGLSAMTIEVAEDRYDRVNNALVARYGEPSFGLKGYWSLEENFVSLGEITDGTFSVFTMFSGEYNPRERRVDASAF